MAFLENGGSLLIYARASVITSDIDRLTEHWDAKSVPRAVASVAPEVRYWREPRSLPLAVLIRTRLIFQRY